MGECNFYEETKWCDSCGKYVHFLLSLDHSYCVDCGGKVRLFSAQDWQKLNDDLVARRPKGGRPKKRA